MILIEYLNIFNIFIHIRPKLNRQRYIHIRPKVDIVIYSYSLLNSTFVTHEIHFWLMGKKNFCFHDFSAHISSKIENSCLYQYNY